MAGLTAPIILPHQKNSFFILNSIKMKNLSNFQNPFSQCFLVVIMFFIYGTRMSGQYDLLHQHPSDQVNRNDAVAIADDGSGHTYLAGDFMNTITLGAFTLTTIPNPQGNGWPFTSFIGKFDSNTSTWVWAKNIVLVPGQNYNGSNISSYVRSKIWDMTLDNQGNIYITGEYAGTVSFDNITLTSTKQGSLPTNDIFIAKLNSSGNFVWAKSFGSKAGWDSCKSIAVDGSNNIYAGGFFTTKVVSCDGTDVDKYDVFVIKLNNAGTSLWQKRYSSSLNPCGCTGCNISNNYLNDLSTDASGNVYISGTYFSTMSFGTGPSMSITSTNGTNDIFVAKLNGSGITQWVKSAGGPVLDVTNAVYTDVSGNVYTGSQMNNSALVSKYNSNGTFLWSVNPYSGLTNSTVTRINPFNNSLLVNDAITGFKTISMSDGSVISSDSLIGNTVTGSLLIKDVEVAGSGYVFNLNARWGYVTLDNLTVTASCTSGGFPACSVFGDMVMIRTSLTPPPPAYNVAGTPFKPDASNFNAFEIYPNPAKDVLQVTLPPSEKDMTFVIQNQFGKTIWSDKVDSLRSSMNIHLDGNQFQNGIYYLVCLINGEIQTKRFVIAK
jgi:hypothetical protein